VDQAVKLIARVASQATADQPVPKAEETPASTPKAEEAQEHLYRKRPL